MLDRFRAFGTRDAKRRTCCWRAGVEHRGAWINFAETSPDATGPDATGFAGAHCVEAGIGDGNMFETNHAANHDEGLVATRIYVAPGVVAVRS
jgi:hypothetical protein